MFIPIFGRVVFILYPHDGQNDCPTRFQEGLVQKRNPAISIGRWMLVAQFFLRLTNWGAEFGKGNASRSYGAPPLLEFLGYGPGERTQYGCRR